MSIFVYIATSLDGFIAAEDGDLSWLSEIPNPDQSDFGFADFMSRVDALVMGRRTYEKVVSFSVWPYDKPVFVLSNTLGSRPADAEKELESPRTRESSQFRNSWPFAVVGASCI